MWFIQGFQGSFRGSRALSGVPGSIQGFQGSFRGSRVHSGGSRVHSGVPGSIQGFKGTLRGSRGFMDLKNFFMEIQFI